MLHTSPSLDTESPKKIKNVLMGERYMLPNSRIKGFQLELLACHWMHLKVDGFMGAVFLFTEDHREIMNPAAYNVSVTKYVVATDPVLLFFPPPSPRPHYLNIKPISLARHGSIVLCCGGDCRHALDWYGCMLLFYSALQWARCNSTVIINAQHMSACLRLS